MPNLRDYRDRIKSVTSTRKITSAMKMVAASKLRRTQEQAQSAQPYAKAMASMLARVSGNFIGGADSSPKLLVGTGKDEKHLLIVVTAERGLCGGFNAYVIKKTLIQIAALESQGKEVSLICIGRKGYVALLRAHADKIIHYFDDVIGKDKVEYAKVYEVAQMVLSRFDASEFDVCTMLYNRFVSVLVQEPATMQLIPFVLESKDDKKTSTKELQSGASSDEETGYKFPYSYEPSEDEILNALLPRNVGVQIFSGLLDSAAGEQAARMTAMDNATRNAGDMISDLTLQYNRARQAYITTELIEIIAGAESL
jgi:F-type H+-transporting ATPase subunit gamma